MRKITPVFITLIIISAVFISCEVEKKISDKEKTKIILVNPSSGYLKSIDFMITNKVIDIPNLELVVILSDVKKREKTGVLDFVRGNQFPYISIDTVSGDLNPHNLFQKNSYTDFFHNKFEETDGIIFLGGADFSPTVYGQDTRLLTEISDPYRSFFEMSFLFHLLGGNQDENFNPYLEENPDYVIYGFCLGMQTMNVATGGSMHQDIPSDVYGLSYVQEVLALDTNQIHRNYWRNFGRYDGLRSNSFHQIQFIENGFFTNRLSYSLDFHPLVRSSHHQAVKDIGKGLSVVATSMDGKIIEAMVHQKYKNVLGVQFHPEYGSLYDPEGKKYKFSPEDMSPQSDYEVLEKNNSLNFHYEFWKYFSKLFPPKN